MRELFMLPLDINNKYHNLVKYNLIIFKNKKLNINLIINYLKSFEDHYTLFEGSLYNYPSRWCNDPWNASIFLLFFIYQKPQA